MFSVAESICTRRRSQSINYLRVTTRYERLTDNYTVPMYFEFCDDVAQLKTPPSLAKFRVWSPPLPKECGLTTR